MIRERRSKPTLTPFLLNHGDTLRFALRGGSAWEMTLLATSAEVLERNHAARGYTDKGHAGGDYLLDPWILFWEMFRQQHGPIRPLPPC